MATTPFRIAFWSLLMGTVVSILLAIPTSQGMVLAKHEKSRSPVSKRSDTSLADLRRESAVPVIFDAGSRRIPSPDGRRGGSESLVSTSDPQASEAIKSVPDPYFPASRQGTEPEPTPARAVPVKIAAASPGISLGIAESEISPPLHSRSEPVPGIDRAITAAAPAEDRSETPSAVPQEPRTITVPAPRQPDSAPRPTDGELKETLASIRNGLLELQVEDLKRNMQQTKQGVEDLKREQWLQEIRGIKAEMEQIREQVKQPTPRELPAASEDRPVPNPESAVATVAAESSEPSLPSKRSSSQDSILIRDGRVPGTKSFEFRDAPISDVLKTLGDYSGWTVVVQPEVTGSYTGEFLNADPDQAFAIAVKLFECSISARGTYALVGKRSERGSR